MKKIIGYILRKTMRIYWTYIESKIPKIEIDDMHIRNTKILTNREKLLTILPKDGIVAEIGVDKGDFSKKIFEITSPKNFHLVDSWDNVRYNKRKEEKLLQIFEDLIKERKVKVHIGQSTVISNHFNDNYFDWIYIDTSHSYMNTIEELNLYSKKIKQGGIIAGHDYIIGNWTDMIRYGVIEAVYEFCVNNEWEIIYITMELNENPSFAIRKIN